VYALLLQETGEVAENVGLPETHPEHEGEYTRRSELPVQ
jgi:hypothetical protein